MDHQQTYTLSEVLEGEFEAVCTADYGMRYLWHEDCGLRVDVFSGMTTMILDPARLPDGPWVATALGDRELQRR
jgi:hypothetical protein